MTAPVAHPRTELDETTALWVRAYTEARDEIHRLEEVAAAARRNIEQALGDTEEGVIDGQIVVRWTHVTTSRVDLKKLETEHPEIAEKFRVPQLTRRFSIPDPEAVTP